MTGFLRSNCPACGGSPDQLLEYLSPENPRRPTKITDGTGDVTVLEYDSDLNGTLLDSHG